MFCSSIVEGLLLMSEFLETNNVEYVAHEFGEESIFFIYKKTA